MVSTTVFNNSFDSLFANYQEGNNCSNNEYLVITKVNGLNLV